jgi:hypothetical protein
MAARDRDTYVHRFGVTPETTSVISSKNKIYAIPADGQTTLFQIGVVATFDPSESRSIEPVRGIGYGDHVAELVPGVTEPMTLAVTRTAQYLSMIYQVFGYKGGIDGIVRSLRHHKWPFDVVQEVVISRLVASVDQDMARNIASQSDFVNSINPQNFEAILTYYEGCWISDYSASYAADAALVQENVTINVTDIVANPAAVYDELNKNLFNDGSRSKIMGVSYEVNTGAQIVVPSGSIVQGGI